MPTNRRQLITGLISFIAAPAIVRAGSLMPVKAIKDDSLVGGTWFREVRYKSLVEFEKYWIWNGHSYDWKLQYDHARAII